MDDYNDLPRELRAAIADYEQACVEWEAGYREAMADYFEKAGGKKMLSVIIHKNPDGPGFVSSVMITGAPEENMVDAEINRHLLLHSSKLLQQIHDDLEAKDKKRIHPPQGIFHA